MRIRVWYVPYAYGMKYAYGTQHIHHLFQSMNTFKDVPNETGLILVDAGVYDICYNRLLLDLVPVLDPVGNLQEMESRILTISNDDNKPPSGTKFST